MTLYVLIRIANMGIFSLVYWLVLQLFGYHPANADASILSLIIAYIVYELINGKFLKQQNDLDIGYATIALSLSTFFMRGFGDIATFDMVLNAVAFGPLLLLNNYCRPLPLSSEVQILKYRRLLKQTIEFNQYRLQLLKSAKEAGLDVENFQTQSEFSQTIPEVEEKILELKNWLKVTDKLIEAKPNKFDFNQNVKVKKEE